MLLLKSDWRRVKVKYWKIWITKCERYIIVHVTDPSNWTRSFMNNTNLMVSDINYFKHNFQLLNLQNNVIIFCFQKLNIIWNFPVNSGLYMHHPFKCFYIKLFVTLYGVWLYSVYSFFQGWDFVQVF